MCVVSIVLRAIMLFLSLVSFIPQYRCILFGGTSSGISLFYVLFNLITATEQFTFGLYFSADNAEIVDTIIHSPPSADDWLNFTQLAGVFLCHLILFALCIHYQPNRIDQKSTVVAIYVCFFLISIAPALLEFHLPGDDENLSQGRRWYSTIFVGAHSIFVNPVATLIGITAVFPQVRETNSRPSAGALSVTGLGLQTVVVAIVAIYWPARMTFSTELANMPPLRKLVAWFQVVGWAAVDNAVFAIVQGILFLVAIRTKSRGLTTIGDEETTPLLQG